MGVIEIESFASSTSVKSLIIRIVYPYTMGLMAEYAAEASGLHFPIYQERQLTVNVGE